MIECCLIERGKPREMALREVYLGIFINQDGTSRWNVSRFTLSTDPTPDMSEEEPGMRLLQLCRY